MEITAAWLQQWDNEEISDEVLPDRIGEMVASRDGARGFFVVSLEGESVLMDRLPDAVVGQLRGAGAGVVDLSFRNLAMSTATAVHHRRTGDGAQQAGSVQSSAIGPQQTPGRIQQRMWKRRKIQLRAVLLPL